MPPRDPHRAERDAARLQAYRDGVAEFQATDPESRALAVANCGLCDDDGYRGMRVCDHVDHAPAAERGMAAVRAALERGGT